jgi:hypothetical protein
MSCEYFDGYLSILRDSKPGVRGCVGYTGATWTPKPGIPGTPEGTCSAQSLWLPERERRGKGRHGRHKPKGRHGLKRSSASDSAGNTSANDSLFPNITRHEIKRSRDKE